MAYRASAASLFCLQNQLAGRQFAGEFPRTSFVYKFYYANIAGHVTLNFQILISFHLEKNDYENTICIFENQQFNVLRRCFYELFQEKNNFQVMAPSKMSAPSAPMVEKYAQREVIFRDEKLLIRPYSQVR